MTTITASGYSLTKPTAEELEEQRKKVFDAPIKFSIVIPAFKTPERFLREMLDSIAEQTYANWEVCVADGSPQDKAASGCWSSMRRRTAALNT